MLETKPLDKHVRTKNYAYTIQSFEDEKINKVKAFKIGGQEKIKIRFEMFCKHIASWIVSNHTALMVEGILVDVQSANLAWEYYKKTKEDAEHWFRIADWPVHIAIQALWKSVEKSQERKKK